MSGLIVVRGIHTQQPGICLLSFLLVCTVNEEFRVTSWLLLSGRTLDHSPATPPENQSLSQGRTSKGLLDAVHSPEAGLL